MYLFDSRSSPPGRPIPISRVATQLNRPIHKYFVIRQAWIVRAQRHSRVVRFLIPCAASCMLAACASNPNQVQFLPWNSSMTTGEPESYSPGSSEQYTPTGAASAESHAVVVPWEASVVPKVPFEYPPYRGEPSPPTEAPQG
jgi:hypothetical protein